MRTEGDKKEAEYAQPLHATTDGDKSFNRLHDCCRHPHLSFSEPAHAGIEEPTAGMALQQTLAVLELAQFNMFYTNSQCRALDHGA